MFGKQARQRAKAEMAWAATALQELSATSLKFKGECPLCLQLKYGDRTHPCDRILTEKG